MNPSIRRRLASASIIAAFNFVWCGFGMFVILGALLGGACLLLGGEFPWPVFGQLLLILAAFGAFSGFMEDMWPGSTRRR